MTDKTDWHTLGNCQVVWRFHRLVLCWHSALCRALTSPFVTQRRNCLLKIYARLEHRPLGLSNVDTTGWRSFLRRSSVLRVRHCNLHALLGRCCSSFLLARPSADDTSTTLWPHKPALVSHRTALPAAIGDKTVRNGREKLWEIVNLLYVHSKIPRFVQKEAA